MEAVVLDDQDPEGRGRVLVAEGWAVPIAERASTLIPCVGDHVFVISEGESLRYRKLTQREVGR